MRLIRGHSLKESIEKFHQADGPGRDPRERALELRKLLARFLDVCNDLAYEEGTRVLHRDSKPASVMLGPFGKTLVVDWGLAKLTGQLCHPPEAQEAAFQPALAGDSSLTGAGATLGTPAYMSPEQAGGRPDQLGAASDI